MGFIYGAANYRNYLEKSVGLTLEKDPNRPEEDPWEVNYIWNVFPVYNQELTAVADVYCYFDRARFNGSGFGELIDRDYDQMNNFRGPNGDAGERYYKDPDYRSRLNDPNLPYNDPW